MRHPFVDDGSGDLFCRVCRGALEHPDHPHDRSGWVPDPDRPGFLRDRSRPGWARTPDGRWWAQVDIDRARVVVDEVGAILALEFEPSEPPPGTVRPAVVRALAQALRRGREPQ